jgi:hypothetical protein
MVWVVTEATQAAFAAGDAASFLAGVRCLKVGFSVLHERDQPSGGHFDADHR